MLRLFLGLAAGVAAGFGASELLQSKRAASDRVRERHDRGVVDSLIDEIVDTVDEEREMTERTNRKARLAEVLEHLTSEYRRSGKDERPNEKRPTSEEVEVLRRSYKDLRDTVDQMRKEVYRGRNDMPRKPKNENNSEADGFNQIG